MLKPTCLYLLIDEDVTEKITRELQNALRRQMQSEPESKLKRESSNG